MKNLKLLDTRGEDRPLIEALLHTLAAEVALTDLADVAEWALRYEPPTPGRPFDWIRNRATAEIEHEAFQFGTAYCVALDMPGRRYRLFADSANLDRDSDRLIDPLCFEDLAPFAVVEDIPGED